MAGAGSRIITHMAKRIRIGGRITHNGLSPMKAMDGANNILLLLSGEKSKSRRRQWMSGALER
jgi:hypothetical protein